MAEMCKATRETRDRLTDVENNMVQRESSMMGEMQMIIQVQVSKMQSQIEARADSRLSELRDELLRSHAESSSAKTVPAVDKTPSASVDVECTLRDDDYVVSRDLGARPCVQAPRDRTPSRLGMPR